jgi:hypothetical protein
MMVDGDFDLKSLAATRRGMRLLVDDKISV